MSRPTLLTTTVQSTSMMRLLTTIILLHWMTYYIIIYTTLPSSTTVLSSNIIMAPKHEILAPQFISFIKLLLLLPSFVLDYIVGVKYFMMHSHIYGCNIIYASAFTTTTRTMSYNLRRRSVANQAAEFKRRSDGISGSGSLIRYDKRVVLHGDRVRFLQPSGVGQD